MDQAEAEIATAERIDPNSAQVSMFWAQYYAVNSMSEQAIGKAKEAVRLSGESLTSLMALAGIYRATARFDEMRETLERIIEIADFPGIAKEIEQIFGYNAEASKQAGDVDTKIDLVGIEKSDGGVGRLKLKLGGDKLGASGGPGLGGDKLKPPSGGLGGQDLQLDLNLNKR